MVMTMLKRPMRPGVLVATLLLWIVALGARAGEVNPITPFIGDYTGSAEVISVDGERIPRDMSVSIRANDDGFTVQWTSITRKPDGRLKEKSYSIDFLPSERGGIYSAAMRRNVFGHAVQLDPMKGEPFVWGRIHEQTLTVYSLFVDENGGYELQQFDRTLAEGGLILEFTDLRNGDKQRSVETFLTKQ
ncbi:hypothetical protein [Pseudodonghicola flavimaris]|uniref:Uncharacterized protein n=1 Tax=Pseudodonghicola flavimaris TaxID=3050036 RepID=A0ABT7F1N8_9RHOB|nr:hypothetical protein [Pseudodonghicola flavimaris]MDK3018521.1 hypothetical protein [Pseudodonghicola flavimaris]